MSPAARRHPRPSATELAHIARIHRLKQQQLATPEPTPERTLPPNAAPSMTVSMPRELPVPMLLRVSPASLAAIDPELGDIPVEFVRKSVSGMSQRIADVMHTVVPKALPGRDRQTIECVARDPSVELSEMPTHYLAVYDPKAKTRQSALLYPANSIVLASQCASFNTFGPTTRKLDSTNSLTLPIVPCPLPAPRVFGILNSFLYTHNVQQLISALLPMPAAALANITAASVGIAAHISQTMSEWLSMRALLSSLKTVHGVYANAVALNVNEDRLWSIIRFAWTVLIGAVERSAGIVPPSVHIDDEEADAADAALGDAPPPYEA